MPDTSSLKLSLQLADGTINLSVAGSILKSARSSPFSPGMEPPAGSKVIADYRAGAKPNPDQFQPEPGSCARNGGCEGQWRSRQLFHLYGGVVARFTFAQAPAEMATLMIDYRKNLSLLDHFKPGRHTRPGFGEGRRERQGYE